MKTALQKIVDVLNEIENVTADIELGQLINDATLLLEGAMDRCTAIDEELAAMADAIRDEDEDALDPIERDEAKPWLTNCLPPWKTQPTKPRP